jgi:hypothetical protein
MFVIDRAALFLVAVGVFVVCLPAIAVYYFRRVRRSSGDNWENILKRLVPVDRSCVAEVALDIIDESGQQRRDESSAVLEPSEIWKLVGGMEGLKAIEANCVVLIDLAFYVQQRYPEAVVTTEQLRLNAREIAWHVERLKAAAESGKLDSVFAMYAQRATATYYLMTRQVLALYEQDGLPMLASLQRAL